MKSAGPQGEKRWRKWTTRRNRTLRTMHKGILVRKEIKDLGPKG